MRYITDDRNAALAFLNANRPAELQEVFDVLGGLEYQVQYCGQAGRQNELIFSPSISNARIKDGLTARGWEAGVGLANPDYNSGKDVDFYKNGVVVEVQFAHYGLCMTDISRMQRLHAGGLQLTVGPNGASRPVVAGIEIVVQRAMPTSQSVAHMEQLRTRGAPLATTLPLLMLGIDPPQAGEVVVQHDLVPRSRKSRGSKRLTW